MESVQFGMLCDERLESKPYLSPNSQRCISNYRLYRGDRSLRTYLGALPQSLSRLKFWGLRTRPWAVVLVRLVRAHKYISYVVSTPPFSVRLYLKGILNQ